MTLLAVRSLEGPLPVDRPAIHPDDEGFLRGRSVFETLRVYGGRPFLLAEHLERLRRSAEALGLPEPDLPGLAAAGAAVADAGAPDAVLRLLWTPGREGAGEPVVLALVSTLPPDLEERRARGLRLAALEWTPGPRLASTKSTSYAENLAAQDEAHRRVPPDLEERRARGLRLAALEWTPGPRLSSTKSTSYAENLAAQDEAHRRGCDDALLVSPTASSSRRRPRTSGGAKAAPSTRPRSPSRSSPASPAPPSESSPGRPATSPPRASTTSTGSSPPTRSSSAPPSAR